MPGNKNLRIILDTNIWISFLISNRQRQLDVIFKEPGLKLVFSIELLNEIKEVTAKPKLRKYFSSNAMEEMLNAFDNYIELIQVKSKVVLCRDPGDNFLLALALDGKADFLITGDLDLLTMETIGKTKICSINFFLSTLKL